MIQVEPIENFSGFGIGQGQGEYFHSQGMSKSLFGMSTRWNITNQVTNGILGALINWFTQGTFSGTSYNYGLDSSGNIFRSQVGGFPWTLERSIGFSSHGNGLIFDQTNRLLYANDRYLGMYDGTTSTDNWKDFGMSFTTVNFRPMDTYEDWVVIGNINQVALLNVTDNSFNTNALNLPSGFNIQCIKSNSNGILIGANFNNRGVLILWQPNYTRSIAPWIWRNANIKTIVPTDDGWVVFTANGIYKTNGYSISPILPKLPDNLSSGFTILNNLQPQGAEISGEKLFFWGSFITSNRQQAGLYILDLDSSLLEFVRVPNGCVYGVGGGAIFYDNNFNMQLSYTTDNPITKNIGTLINGTAPQAHFVSQQLGQGGNEKVAEGVKLTFGFDTSQSFAPTSTTFDVSVKIYNFKRPLYVFAVTNAASTSANILKVNGSTLQQSKGRVGDEVTILEGVNAGQVRHITAVANQGTSTESWTLDSNLPNNTENTVRMVTSPFRLARKFSIANPTELVELFFDVQDRIKGKKFLVKLLLDNINTTMVLETKDGQFIYDDLQGKTMTEQEFNQAQSTGNVNLQQPTDQPAPTVEDKPTFDEYEPILSQIRSPKDILKTVPTFTPKSFAESIQYVDTGTLKQVYFYVNGTWVAIGSVNAANIFDKYTDLIHWNSIDGFTVGGTVGNVRAFDGNLLMATNTTLNSTSYIWSQSTYFSICETGKLLTVEWQIANITFISGFTARLHMTTSFTAPPSDTAHHFGFTINDAVVYGTTGNGVAETQLDLSVFIQAGYQHTRLKAVCNRGTDVKFYFNNVLSGTITTNLPDTGDLGFNMGITTNVSSQKDFSINRILIEKEY